MSEKISFKKDERGLLVPLDFDALPFVPKRSFFIKDVPKNTTRGRHAHYKTKQFIICLAGEIQATLDDGFKKEKQLLREGDTLFHDSLEWGEFVFLSGKEQMWVFCSTPYDSSDYIFDYEEFINIIKEGN